MNTPDRLTQLLNAAADVASLLRRRESFHFQVRPDTAFYLDAAGVTIRVFRHDEARIEVNAHVQVPFAWRIATDQDEAGVYMVVARRGIVGAAAALTPLVSEAALDVFVPRAAPLLLRLARCRFTLEHVDNHFMIPGELAAVLAAGGAPPGKAQLPPGKRAPRP